MNSVLAADVRDQRSDPSALVIYFYGTDDEQAVKIGKTTRRPASRGREHARQGATTATLHFLAGVRGVSSDEKYLHRHFAMHRIEREWFRAHGELVDYIRWLKNQWFVTDNDSIHPSELDRVPSDSWLPCDGRTAPAPVQLTFGTWGSVQAPEITGDDFYTHPDVIEAARQCLGGFDLDPASHPAANRVVRAPCIFTFRDNGLLSPWAGRVWCNPPFGQWEAWAPKILGEWTSGRVSSMCVLLPSRALTAQCVAPLVAAARAIFIPARRIPFWGPKAGSPDEGHPILYFGDAPERFRVAFSELGTVFVPAHEEAS